VNSTGETPAESPVKLSRRARWLTVVTVVVVVVVVAAAWSRGEEEPLASARSGGGRKTGCSDTVRGHPRMQACGPQRSQRRQVWIDPYSRGPQRAA
jgi:uncharacterized membrane protein